MIGEPTTTAFPQDVEPFARSLDPGGALGALYTAEWTQQRELAHGDYRSAWGDPGPHEAGARWRDPVDVEAIRIRWRRGFEPRRRRISVLRGDVWWPIVEWGPAEAESERFAVGGAAIAGYRVEQEAGGGSARHPGELRVGAVAVEAASRPAITIALLRDGIVERPAMPLLQDGDPRTFVDLSDADAALVELGEAQVVGGVSLDLVRLAGSGAVPLVAEWLRRPDLLALDGQPVPVDVRAIDRSGAGVVAGVVRVWLGLDRPRRASSLRLDLPARRPSLLAATRLAVEAGSAAPGLFARRGSDRSLVTPGVDRAPPEPPSDKAQRLRDRASAVDVELRADDDLDVDRARGLAEPLRHAVSLGVPGRAERVGVAPDGSVFLPWPGGHACCLHVAVGIDGVRLGEAPSGWLERNHDPRRGLLRMRCRDGSREIDLQLAVDPGAGSEDVPVLVLRAAVRNTHGTGKKLSFAVALAARDWLRPLPLPATIERAEGWTSARLGGSTTLLARVEGPWELDGDGREPRDELRLLRDVVVPPGARAEVLLRLPLGPTDALPPPEPSVVRCAARLQTRIEGALAGQVRFRLPHPEWDDLGGRLLAAGLLFLGDRDRVSYGQRPSVYAGDVFGLEEDWLLRGLAQRGLVDRSLGAFRETFLDPQHLDRSHYLFDLRAGLTPWQLLHLLALHGLDGSALGHGERGLLRGLGDWIRAARRETDGATGAPDQRGVRVFPGLLPPARYGGDVDFPTQSLSTNAACAAGLRSLGELLGEPDWTREAGDLRAAVRAALDAVREGDRHRLDTGGGDPGQYLQLVAAGILGPLDLLHPDDPLLLGLDAQLEREGRLFCGLPRFDGWGTGCGVDAHYGIGRLLNELRRGRRSAFQRGLVGAIAFAMDPDVQTFREVGPLQLDPVSVVPPAWLPGRRLSSSEPCVGGVGMVLQLLRSAAIVELPEPDGRLGRRLRLLGGVPRRWWRRGPLEVHDAPTLAGRVSVEAVADPSGGLVVEAVADPSGGLVVEWDAPGADSVEIVDRDGVIHTMTGRSGRERFP